MSFNFMEMYTASNVSYAARSLHAEENFEKSFRKGKLQSVLSVFTSVPYESLLDDDQSLSVH